MHAVAINEPENVDAGVTSVCISPDGRLVAAGSLDTIVRIWDVQTGLLVERLKGHRDSVYSVAFTPDGRGLVSGSLDKTLKYWDVRPILRGRDGPSGANGASGPSGSIAKAGAGAAGGKDGGEKGSTCTMNFVGHKVRSHVDYRSPFVLFLPDLLTTIVSLGLCSLCCRLARWSMGRLWIQGQGCSILGCENCGCAVYASGPQEFRYVLVDPSIQKELLADPTSS